MTGADKVEALRRLRAGDRSIPAGRVEARRSLIVADRAVRAIQARQDAEGRDLRCGTEILDPGVDIVGDDIAVPMNAQRIAQLGIRLELKTIIVGLALQVLIHGQVVFDRELRGHGQG